MDNTKTFLDGLPAVVIDESLVDDDSLAKANLTKSPDLMYVDYVLCHASVNGNRDSFASTDLQSRHTSIRLKPIDWEHSDVIIGVNYDSVFIDKPEDVPVTFASLAKDFTPFILVKGAIYKTKFPAYATIIENRHKAGTLRYSMEVLFGSARCSVCGNEYEKSVNYCQHLNERFSKGTSAFRELQDITFMGSGVVKNPADKDAVSLALAELIANAGQLKDNISNESLVIAMRKVIDTAVSIVSGIVWSVNLTAEERIQKLNEVFGDLREFIQNPDNFIKDTHMLTAPSYGYATKADKNETQGGKAVMAFKTFETESDFNAFKDSLIAQINKAPEGADVIKALEAKIAESDTRVASLQTDLTAKDAKIADLTASIEKTAQEAVVAKRLAALKEAGVELSDDARNTFASEFSAWTDEKFDMFVKLQKPSKPADATVASQVEPDLASASAAPAPIVKPVTGYDSSKFRTAFKGAVNARNAALA